jgi:hypothetical protein
MQERELPPWLCRFAPAGSALAVFLAMSWLYWHGQTGVYEGILRSWGIVPFNYYARTLGRECGGYNTREGKKPASTCEMLLAPGARAVCGITARKADHRNLE